jgi:hyperosmotically inducible periplasmic protein
MHTRASILAVATVTAFATAAFAGIQSASAADAASSTAAPTKKETRAHNRALSRAVRKSLTQVKGLDSSRINVIARGSSVTLAGSVPEQPQIDAAGAAAAKVSGVSHVDNRLTIAVPGH